MKRVVFFVICFFLLSFNVVAKDYVIGDGDTLQISVWDNPDMVQKICMPKR